jgi:hypothetical protein
MKYLCNDSDHVFMVMLQDQLKERDIPIYVKNKYSANNMVPWNITCYSAELFVMDEDDFDHAKQIMDDLAKERHVGADSFSWVCPKCKERLEPQFNECWNCSYVRDSDTVE